MSQALPLQPELFHTNPLVSSVAENAAAMRLFV
jgi:hypothetical protein